MGCIRPSVLELLRLNKPMPPQQSTNKIRTIVAEERFTYAAAPLRSSALKWLNDSWDDHSGAWGSHIQWTADNSSSAALQIDWKVP
eukprot:11389282-Karenia_brevis.AAC.1